MKEKKYLKDSQTTIRINIEMKNFILKKGLSIQKIIDNWLKRNFKKKK